jgi:hypothetical protein
MYLGQFIRHNILAEPLQIERGEQAASVHALVRIAKALGIRLRDLVNDI